VVILAGIAALVAGLVVLLWLVFESPDPDHEPDEPEPAVALPAPPPPPAPPAPAAPAAPKPRRVSSPKPPAPPPRAPVRVPIPAPPPNPSGVVGVAECDDLLGKLAACAANQTKENRRQHINKLMSVYRESWLRAVKKSGGGEDLTSACNKAATHFRITLAEAGCEL